MNCRDCQHRENGFQAAVKQIEDIRYIETHVGFSQLTEELEETAVCRLRYPEATLKERER